MFTQFRKTTQFVTLLLIISVSTLFAGGPLMGALQTDSSVQINGNSGESGATILSGSEIKTSKMPATVNLPKLGLVALGPNTTAVLDFDAATINLRMVTGIAQISAASGVEGKILTETGNLIMTSADSSSISSEGVMSGGKKPWEEWSDGEKAALIVALIASGILIIYLVARCDGASCNR